jgi:hypothetical protein
VPHNGLSHESAGPNTINNLALIGLMCRSPSVSTWFERKITGTVTTFTNRPDTNTDDRFNPL